jgi:hypothetical protein
MSNASRDNAEKKGSVIPHTIQALLLTLALILFTGCSEEINPFDTSPPKEEIKDLEEKKEETVGVENQAGGEGGEGGEGGKEELPSSLHLIETPEEKGIPDPEETRANVSEVRRSPSDDQRIRSSGIWNLQAHLQEDKINRQNQLRNISLMKTYPDLFGVGLDFEPLLSLEGKGPGRVRVVGSNFQLIEFELASAKEKFEIYPNYNLRFLHDDAETQKEKIEITYLNGEKEELVDRVEAKWTQKREINLEDRNLNDIVTLIDAKRPPPDEKLKFKDLNQWLVAIIGGLDKFNIKFEEIKEGTTFLKIRTSTEMRQDKKANAYDLCVWLANKAIEHGFNCEFIILPNHALLSVSSEPSQTNNLKSSEQKYIETSMLLDKEKITQGAFEEEKDIKLEKAKESMRIGQEKINEQFKIGADNMIALKIEEWDNL